jgi:hypothetical protein
MWGFTTAIPKDPKRYFLQIIAVILGFLARFGLIDPEGSGIISIETQGYVVISYRGADRVVALDRVLMTELLDELERHPFPRK